MYTVTFLPKFASQFSNFPQDQQDKILAFVETFEAHGLSDFTKYEGKIAYSWDTLEPGDPNYEYCQANALWHYHVGIPEYKQEHPKYKTSEWVLHFQWPGCGNHINLVDIYSHYDRRGNFHIPPGEYLER